MQTKLVCLLLVVVAISTASALTLRTDSSSSCKNPLLGKADFFNIFLLGTDRKYDLKMNGGDSQGPVAVNGGMQVTNFGTADGIPCPDKKAFNLIVAGDLNYNGGELACGRFVVEGKLIMAPFLKDEGTLTTPGVQADVEDKTGLSFGDEAKKLRGVNNALCDLDACPAEVNEKQITFTGRGNKAVEVFSVEGEDIDCATFLEFKNICKDTTIIVNVKHASSVSFSNFAIKLPADITPENILWNFCGTKKISIKNFEFLGSILAPKARVTLENTQVLGTVIAASLEGVASAQVHFHPFCGLDCE